jgi:hypothetical protein
LGQLHEQHPDALASPRHCPSVVLVYGEQRANAALAGELELDGFQVHRASQPGTLRERCRPGEVDLIIFGRSPHRGLDVLRALRAGEFAPGASDHDGSRPVEIPDALLNALAHRLAEQLAGQLADHLAGAVLSEGSPWMRFEEAVEYTRVPVGTFRKLSAEGTFPAHGGKRKVYHRQELDTALLGLSR